VPFARSWLAATLSAEENAWREGILHNFGAA
jgi:hypothetical protein